MGNFFGKNPDTEQVRLEGKSLVNMLENAFASGDPRVLEALVSQVLRPCILMLRSMQENLVILNVHQVIPSTRHQSQAGQIDFGQVYMMRWAPKTEGQIYLITGKHPRQDEGGSFVVEVPVDMVPKTMVNRKEQWVFDQVLLPHLFRKRDQGEGKLSDNSDYQMSTYLVEVTHLSMSPQLPDCWMTQPINFTDGVKSMFRPAHTISGKDIEDLVKCVFSIMWTSMRYVYHLDQIMAALLDIETHVPAHDEYLECLLKLRKSLLFAASSGCLSAASTRHGDGLEVAD